MGLDVRRACIGDGHGLIGTVPFFLAGTLSMAEQVAYG